MPPTPDEILAALEGHRLVPVVSISDAADAAPLAEALIAGGLPCMEITLRTPAGLEAIRRATKVAAMLVGAGTVLDALQCLAAHEAGARFIVSPGFDPDVLATATDLGLLYLPGVATPTEVQAARRAGLRAVKFFPASSFGGPATLKAFAAVYPDMRLMPTGGITPQNLADYLSPPNVFACGGSWLAPADAMRRKAWDEIAALTRESRQLLSTSCK
ncbi:MAG: bifunctional 4-hydroxy-2-oxoglutarate aldolase/2-dehydro-3-deoxy-phosphogluconate aldolase [Phycisphaeraceae bacterium]|nr:bifunctional 4-hydroxy-2-oxoglutarate aldolase/2-dehydro-3-deoxy-phosphogluconate aldolase [Phycisphaeraceae bacterium]